MGKGMVTGYFDTDTSSIWSKIGSLDSFNINGDPNKMSSSGIRW